MAYREEGFAVKTGVILIAVVVIIAMIGLIGFALMAKSQSQTSMTTTESTSLAQSDQANTSALGDFMTSFYHDYIASTQSGSTTPTADVLKKYGTQNLVDSFNTSIKRCVQNNPLTISTNLIKDIESGSQVYASFNYDASASVGIDFIVLSKGTTYQIDSATCDAA